MAIELLPYIFGGLVAVFLLERICTAIYRQIKYGAYQRRLKSMDFLQAQVHVYTINHNFIDSLLSFTTNMTLDDWDWRSNSKVWSMGECLKHLQLYNERFIPILENAIQKAKSLEDMVILSGRVVYLSDALLPDNKNGKIYRKHFYKTTTKKRYNPRLPKNLFDENILQDFLKIDMALIEVLKKASGKDLNKRVLVKNDFGWGFRYFRLGELIEIITAHNMRHFRQIVAIYHDWENFTRDRYLDEDRSELLSLDPL